MNRVCHVQLLPLLSGVQRAMLEIFKHLDRDRYEPHVACQGPGPLSEELQRQGIPCHFVPSLRRPIVPWLDWSALQSLRRLFVRERFALVHTHSSKPGVLGRLAAHQAGVPRVVHQVHSFAFHEFSSRGAAWAYRRIERWAGQFCDRVIFVNHEERELAIREGLLPAEKCLTVYNGVDLAAFAPLPDVPDRQQLRHSFGLQPDETAILFMGRLDVPKQPLILPRIANALTTLLPETPWRILVAGSGPMKSRLLAKIAELGLKQRFLILGWLNEPQHVFHAADIVLQPSLWEGLPLSLLEAHAAGLPTVGSDVKGVREVVTPQTGILLPATEPAPFARALARLIADPEQRIAMSRAARCRAEAEFDAEANMRRIGALYDELLAEPAAAPLRRAA